MSLQVWHDKEPLSCSKAINFGQRPELCSITPTVVAFLCKIFSNEMKNNIECTCILTLCIVALLYDSKANLGTLYLLQVDKSNMNILLYGCVGVHIEHFQSFELKTLRGWHTVHPPSSLSLALT